MDYEEFFSNRLTQLRIGIGISARDMSLSMGQSPGYINKIENHQNLPSMNGFFSICDYLNISPMDFFNTAVENPKQLNELIEKLNMLSNKQLASITILVDTMLNPE